METNNNVTENTPVNAILKNRTVLGEMPRKEAWEELLYLSKLQSPRLKWTSTFCKLESLILELATVNNCPSLLFVALINTIIKNNMSRKGFILV